MRYPEELEKVIKRMEAVLLDGICRSDASYRQMAINRLKNLSYESLDYKTANEKMGLSQYNPAVYDPISKTITIVKESTKNEILEPVLMHEMCHAVSADGDRVGFSRFDVLDMKKDLGPANPAIMNDPDCLFLVENNNVMFNEAANEFFASSFYGEKPIAYVPFLPIFCVIANVCGYKDTLNLFFANEFEFLLEYAKEEFHLKNDYPLRLLAQEMNAAYSNQGIDDQGAAQCLDLVMSIYANKLKKEGIDIQSAEEIEKYVDINEVFGLKKIVGPDADLVKGIYSAILYNKLSQDFELCNDLDLLDFKNKFYKRISHMFGGTQYDDFDEQTKYFADKLTNVILMLNQNFICMTSSGKIKDDCIAYQFLRSLTNENNELDLSNCSEKEKDYIIYNLIKKEGHDFGPSYKFINTDDLSVYLATHSAHNVKTEVFQHVAVEITKKQKSEELSLDLEKNINLNNDDNN